MDMELESKRADKNGIKEEKEQESHKERVSKTLTYLLRYAALREGLKVDDSGFVELTELLALPMLGHFSSDEIMEAITTSQSHRGSCRFDVHRENGKTLVRASYGRKLEKNPYHNDSKVLTLFETSMQVIIDNLELFDLQDFPDDYLIGSMLHRLARQKKLNNSSLKVLLVPALEHLNLEDVLLTQKTMQIVYTQCPHLRSLSLRNCSYIVTDSMLSQLTKKLRMLEFLNLTGCNHLTDNCLNSIVKNLPHLRKLGLSFNKGITESGVIRLLKKTVSLKLLDVYGLKTSQEAKDEIDRVRVERKIVVILNGLDEKDENGVKMRIKPTYQKGVM